MTLQTALGVLLGTVGINPEAGWLAGLRARTTRWTMHVLAGALLGALVIPPQWWKPSSARAIDTISRKCFNNVER
ncbi:hypothetical protein [Micromonospora costi]|uniref:Uncharacterized protein n=1 Tax=Micromonospora costi TaxID=1530042 RepID=A0A3A9ZYI3_9ACTN|nr:hypothetical protein [Micromonospora costi]RKN52177.1 hypothetical protein D7193_26880 [Micromonospora costi]